MKRLLQMDVRTFVLVTLVSVLVWVWAEGESLTTVEPTVQVEIFADPKGDYVLRLVPQTAEGVQGGVGTAAGGSTGAAGTGGGPVKPGTITGVPNKDGALGGGGGPGGGAVLVVPGYVKLRIEGPTGIAQDAERLLDGKTLRINAPIEQLEGQSGEVKTINLLELLKQQPEVRPFASVLATTDPQSINVVMTHMVTRQVPVKVVTPEGVSLDGEPAPSAASVTIRLPESAAGLLGDNTPARLEFDGDEAVKLREEGPLTLTAAVRLPEALAAAGGGGGVEPVMVGMRPEKMPVTLRVRRRVESYTLRTVPVWVLMQGTELRDTAGENDDAAAGGGGPGGWGGGGGWDVRLGEAFLSDVTVSGPADGVAKVRSGEATVRAIVELSWEDLAKGVKQKQATFAGLPSGVTAGAANTTVSLKISRRGEGGATSEGTSGATP